jgi:hypothetical protein
MSTSAKHPTLFALFIVAVVAGVLVATYQVSLERITASRSSGGTSAKVAPPTPSADSTAAAANPIVGFVGGCEPYVLHAQNRWTPWGAKIRTAPDSDSQKLGRFEEMNSSRLTGGYTVTCPTRTTLHHGTVISGSTSPMTQGGLRSQRCENCPRRVIAPIWIRTAGNQRQHQRTARGLRHSLSTLRLFHPVTGSASGDACGRVQKARPGKGSGSRTPHLLVACLDQLKLLAQALAKVLGQCHPQRLLGACKLVSSKAASLCTSLLGFPTRSSRGLIRSVPLSGASSGY